MSLLTFRMKTSLTDQFYRAKMRKWKYFLLIEDVKCALVIVLRNAQAILVHQSIWRGLIRHGIGTDVNFMDRKEFQSPLC